MEELFQWRKHRCEARLWVYPPPCRKCISSILSCLCSSPALQPHSLLKVNRFHIVLSLFRGRGWLLRSWPLVGFFLSFLNVHFALMPGPNSWSPVCSLFPQRPHMPMPVYTTRRPSVPEPALLMEPRTDNPVVSVRSHSMSCLRSPNASLSPSGGPPCAREMPIADTPQPARQPCVRPDSLVYRGEPRRPAECPSRFPRLAPRAMSWDTPRHHPSILRRTPVPLSATHWQTIPKCPSRLQARNVPRCP